MNDSNVHLVYQCGIANVFTYRQEKVVRLLQSDYRSCEMYTLGMRQAGARVNVWHCDQAGDIREREWSKGKGTLWAAEKRPPNPRPAKI